MNSIRSNESNQKTATSFLPGHTVLCKSNESEMREFRSLSPQTLREILPENSSVFSQCLERYFFKTKDESSHHFREENENSLPE